MCEIYLRTHANMCGINEKNQYTHTWERGRKTLYGPVCPHLGFLFYVEVITLSFCCFSSCFGSFPALFSKICPLMLSFISCHVWVAFLLPVRCTCCFGLVVERSCVSQFVLLPVVTELTQIRANLFIYISEENFYTFLEWVLFKKSWN